MLKLRPGFAVTGELWGVFREVFNENWPMYHTPVSADIAYDTAETNLEHWPGF